MLCCLVASAREKVRGRMLRKHAMGRSGVAVSPTAYLALSDLAFGGFGVGRVVVAKKYPTQEKKHD